MSSAAIITAAGSGRRMGLDRNKVLLPLNNRTVIESAVQPFINLNKFQKIIITHSKDDLVQLKEALKDISVPVVFVEGGKTRQKSVMNGLKALKGDYPETVLIHDAARPWITEALVDSVLVTAERDGSAVPVIPSVNAMKLIDDTGKITAHLKRSETVSAQTPQGFNFKKILNAHELADSESFEAIDDTELWDRYIGKVSTVKGDTSNIKITYREDLDKK